MAKRSARTRIRLPKHGYSLVTVTVRDANGFVHHYGDIEAPVGAVRDAMAIIHLQSSAAEAAHRGSASA